ncbi:MAG: hypothetical protein DWQ36_00205 [Acidobacteria bacterium]|nr:MAG: hypothetical protein DWQ30_18355 [Acidobacteriota bacterium]REK12126.1 MAG: hypothetical protein DWQ36_00205 [Acidobacteriota bacterium]
MAPTPGTRRGRRRCGLEATPDVDASAGLDLTDRLLEYGSTEARAEPGRGDLPPAGPLAVTLLRRRWRDRVA